MIGLRPRYIVIVRKYSNTYYINQFAVWYNTNDNPGDDHAGYVHKVGANVTEFKPGDRVASYHSIAAPHGSYAEYAIATANTTFHIPARTSFEEAATIPLAAMTAAVGLYQNLLLPLPWTPPSGKRIPLIIYGASTAVGAFALKFAGLSNVHPIIAIAGAGIDYVKSLGIADHIVDYRKNNVAADIKAALNGEKVYLAFDAVTEQGAYASILEVIENPGGKINHLLPVEAADIPEGIEDSHTKINTVHVGIAGQGEGKGLEDIDFGYIMSRYIGHALAEGKFSGHPQTLISGGLNGIEKGLRLLKDGKASATKYVYRVAEN